MADSTTKQPEKYTGPFRRPRFDLYAMLLLLALIAISLAITLLYMEQERFNFEISGGPSVTWVEPAPRGADLGWA